MISNLYAHEKMSEWTIHEHVHKETPIFCDTYYKDCEKLLGFLLSSIRLLLILNIIPWIFPDVFQFLISINWAKSLSFSSLQECWRYHSNFPGLPLKESIQLSYSLTSSWLSKTFQNFHDHSENFISFHWPGRKSFCRQLSLTMATLPILARVENILQREAI